MSDFEYDDVYELESDLYSKNSKTPQQIMMEKYEVVHNRNWKSFLDSIEWDTWCRHETEEEKKIRLEEIEERKRQHEMETHPFKQWF
jgi:hypothetical protein